MARPLTALLARNSRHPATHGRRRLHLIRRRRSSITSSRPPPGSVGAVPLPSTHWRSDAAAPYLSATLASSAWSLTSYGLSTYGLHGADAAVAPTAWSLSCVNVSGVAAVVDARSGETLATDELLHTFALGAPAAGCAELRLDFPSATALSDAFFAAWAAEDACADADGFKDAFGHTRSTRRRHHRHHRRAAAAVAAARRRHRHRLRLPPSPPPPSFPPAVPFGAPDTPAAAAFRAAASPRSGSVVAT